VSIHDPRHTKSNNSAVATPAHGHRLADDLPLISAQLGCATCIAALHGDEARSPQQSNGLRPRQCAEALTFIGISVVTGMAAPASR